ncbi:phage tail assembly protein [Vibrio sp. Isolate23]|uniref:phage tail assembly protein n=1 Tax=Vibrio sp. Isolate23 TaxID=2908533 RepID=UPI001EFE847A|nr:phage tail assembly protein [Vibrio sp. Isolate23]MCG9681210.1 phage tail assembly protein [Vibrio sp. Isolate23]
MATPIKHSSEVKKVKLAVPHEKDGEMIEELEITKPHSGNLRGLNLIKVCEMDFETGQILVPRITRLDERDMLNFAPENWEPVLTEIASFFVNTKQ